MVVPARSRRLGGWELAWATQGGRGRCFSLHHHRGYLLPKANHKTQHGLKCAPCASHIKENVAAAVECLGPAKGLEFHLYPLLSVPNCPPCAGPQGCYRMPVEMWATCSSWHYITGGEGEIRETNLSSLAEETKDSTVGEHNGVAPLLLLQPFLPHSCFTD